VGFGFVGTGMATLVTQIDSTGSISTIARSATFGPAPIQTPEPATWLLLGSGLIGLVLWRRRQHTLNVQ
jgi:hypothetical protein